jgi:hypothetical protein
LRPRTFQWANSSTLTTYSFSISLSAIAQILYVVVGFGILQLQFELLHGLVLAVFGPLLGLGFRAFERNLGLFKNDHHEPAHRKGFESMQHPCLHSKIEGVMNRVFDRRVEVRNINPS